MPEFPKKYLNNLVLSLNGAQNLRHLVDLILVSHYMNKLGTTYLHGVLVFALDLRYRH